VAFLDGTNPALAGALVPRAAPQIPMVVFVVDDSEDDELTTAIAEASNVPADGYGGAWAAQATSKDGLTEVKFVLIRRGGGWERAWTLPSLPADMLDAITGGAHHVAILPRELAGDLNELNLASLGGGLIVEAEPSEAVAAARSV
jgi:hypothetical protein